MFLGDKIGNIHSDRLAHKTKQKQNLGCKNNKITTFEIGVIFITMPHFYAISVDIAHRYVMKFTATGTD